MALMKLFPGQQWRHRPREQIYRHGEGGEDEREEGEGEIYGEDNMDICITICKVHSQWEFAV